MCFFRKKQNKLPQELDDKVLLSETARSFESIILLAKDNESLVRELRVLQEKVNYLIASEKATVVEFDKKISAKVVELRETIASDAVNIAKLEKIILDIKLAINDRNAIL